MGFLWIFFKKYSCWVLGMFVSLNCRKSLVIELITSLFAIDCTNLLIPLARGSVGSESISL